MLTPLLMTALLAASPLPYDLVSPATGKEDTAVIALHGALSTAKFYCGTFMRGRIAPLARERNYLVVCPGGTGANPKYEKYEARVLALREEILRKYPSVRRVFLLGHSLGGRGALLIGLRHSDKFEAIAAVAPALKLRKDKVGSVDAISELLKATHQRVFFAWGLVDFLVPFTPAEIGALTLAGHGLLEPHPYSESHLTISAESIADVFDFFDRVRGNATLVRNVQ